MKAEKKKVVLVDDEPVNLKIAANILAKSYEVFPILSAGKMFDYLQKKTADIILLDILMPEINGYEAIRILKSNSQTKDIPVIFVTSMRDPESEMQGFSLGAVDFIIKPFIPRILLKRIEVHLMIEFQRKALFFVNTNLQKIVDMKTASVVDLQRAVLLTVGELVECRDHVTGQHVERTSQIMAMLIEEMKRLGVYSDEINKWDTDLVLHSSLLHDLGKMSISDRILLKPGKLTCEEFEQIKKHAEFGEQIIAKIQQKTAENSFLTYAKIMAGTHHEKWDGSGYPRKLAGQDIPLLGRLMAVADVYDALISDRPYKRAFSAEEAAQIIIDSCGTQFDPMIKDSFVNVAKRLA
ncbi:MAG: response regulator [Oscillospiraceae bacterium]|nr:response regulator [Oscillospiraceae bacterium]